MATTSRPLGNSGLSISGPLALGGNVFGWTADEATSFHILDAFVAAGMNFIDTADVYSRWKPGHTGGESETVLGKWMKQHGSRGKILIATKVGMDMGDGKKGLSKRYILQAAEDSLRRLQTDRIDLYQSHKDDLDSDPIETLEAYAQLIKQGKVRAMGASNFTAERLAQSLRLSTEHGLPRYESLQPHYNLVFREEYERDLEPLCLKERIGVIPYFALASGFLTGKYRTAADVEGKARAGGVGKYLNPRGLRVLDALDTVAKRTNSNPTRVALAWLIARPSITAPIASAIKLDQLIDLIESTKLTLDDESIRLLNDASAPEAATGA